MSNYYPTFVPHEGPENAPILFVGEAPGETEVNELKPFVGEAGAMLMNALNRNGLSRSDVRLANLCHYRPYGNDFKNLLNTDVLKEGIQELYDFIQVHRPFVIVALGNWPLAFLTGKQGISNWRGSILSYINDPEIKVIPTFHPSYVLRERSAYPTFDLDIKRIKEDSTYREKRLPVREYIIDPRGMDLLQYTEQLCEADYVATDIETVKKSTHILCVGFAPSPELGVCIVPSHNEGRRAIERVLESKAKKVFQFGSFDTTQLVLNEYQINDPYAEKLGRKYYWDTLLAQHVQAPELPRSLEYLTSIYTREPYYKSEGRSNIPGDTKGWGNKVNKDKLYEYNCKDSCCTAEVFELQRAEILDRGVNGDWRYPNLVAMFDFEMSMIEVADHIADSGMPIDNQRRELLEKVLLTKWNKKQFVLDRLTGFQTNVKSPKLKSILYDKDKLGLPTRRNRGGGITTDEDAIVSLIAFCQDKLESVSRADAILDWTVKLNVCKTILEIRGIRQVLSNYVLERTSGVSRTRADGRIHSTYKVGGTETGRWSSSKYVDGTGFNAQTLPRDPVEVDDSLLTNTDGIVRLKAELEADIDEEDTEDDES